MMLSEQERADRDAATIIALQIDLAAARRITENQQNTILQLQARIRQEREHQTGWGNR